MTAQTQPYDSARYLKTPEAVEAYLADAFEAGDAAEIANALGVAARAEGMSQLAQKTGLSRQALYKALSSDGNPEFATVVKVMSGLGFRLAAERVPPENVTAS